MRYFFHLHHGGQFLPDPDGVDLDGMDRVRHTALVGARSIVSHDAQGGAIDLSGRIEVADENGEVVLVMPFREAVLLRKEE